MIDIKQVERIRDILIDRFGEGKGVRDKGLLESAINRPYQKFDFIQKDTCDDADWQPC